jgi:hypothetical protein
VGEDLFVVAALWTGEEAHVLDNAEHRHLDLLPHGQGLLDVDDRNFFLRTEVLN